MINYTKFLSMLKGVACVFLTHKTFMGQNFEGSVRKLITQSIRQRLTVLPKYPISDALDATQNVMFRILK